MLKVEIKSNDDGKTASVHVESYGGIEQICMDLSILLSSLNEKLTNANVEAGHQFKMLFTKGFMDGVCFDTDREHMEHYLAEADNACKRGANPDTPNLIKLMDELIACLKSENSKLSEIKKSLENDDAIE